MNNIQDWGEALRYRWRSVFVVSAATVVLALLYLLVAPQTYTATATLFFDGDSPDPLEQGADPTVQNEGLDTQVDILRSAAVADQVVEDLELVEEEDLQALWRESEARIPLDEWLSEWVSEAVTIENDGDTRVVAITAKAGQADRAAAIANAYANASTAKLLSLTTTAAAGYLQWLEDEVAQADIAVNEAEGRLQEFVAVTGIPNNGDLSAEAARSANIALESAVAGAQAAGASRRGGVSQYAAGEAERSPALQNIRAQLAEKRSELSDMASRLGPRHPEMQSARAEVEMLEQSLAQESGAARAAFASARAAELGSERSSTGAAAGILSAAAAAQNSRLSSMSQNIGRMTTLQSELSIAQQHQADLKRSLSRMQLETNVPRTEVTQLDNARPPLLPSSPRSGLVLFLAVVLGLVLGALLAIVREVLNPYARNPGSLQRALGIPVIGRVALPKQSIRQLVDARVAQ